MKIHTTKKKIVIGIIFVAIILLGGVFLYTNNSKDVTEQAVQTEQPMQEEIMVKPAPVTEESPVATPPVSTPTPTPPTTSNWPEQLTAAQASSLTVVVNKKHKLPSTYVPSTVPVAGGTLRTETASAFNTMVNGASSTGVSLAYGSGYRSYTKQEQLYTSYVARDGQAAADTYSARPGHSEHQTGLAVDVKGSSCYLETCFANTVEGKWIAANAQNYGFIIRYPKGKESITAYQYEPWHLRYLGITDAIAVYNSGKTLEEYYNVPGGGYN